MRMDSSVTVGNTDMYYVSFGNGSRKLVVLPGLSDGLATVKGKSWILSSPYRKYFQDYTVYMFSRKNEMPDGYTIENMADDQAFAMKELGISQASLLGVSQGGMIAQYLAANHPEMITKLILAVTSPNANDTVKTVLSTWIDLAQQDDHTALMVDTAEKLYSEKFLQKNRRLFPLIARFTKPENYDRFLKNANAIMTFDARNVLSRISCPTLIIAGSDDHTVGNSAASDLNTMIRDSELYVYDGLGHGVFEEAKDFYDRVLEFCSR